MSQKLARVHRADEVVTEAQRIERMLTVANTVVALCKRMKIRFVSIMGYAMTAHDCEVGEVCGTLKTQLYLALRIVPEVVSSALSHRHLVGTGVPVASDIARVVTDGLGYDVKTDSEVRAAVAARFLFDRKVSEMKEVAP